MLFGLLIQHVPLFPETYLMGHEKVFVVAAEDFRGWHTGSGRDGRDRCIAIFELDQSDWPISQPMEWLGSSWRIFPRAVCGRVRI